MAKAPYVRKASELPAIHWPEKFRYDEHINGKVQSLCRVCGLHFWSEKARQVCSIVCLNKEVR